MPWSYALDDDSEDWRGSCETREEAVEEALSELADDVAERMHDPDWKDVPGYELNRTAVRQVRGRAPHFYVGFGERVDPADLFDAGDILERAADTADDNVELYNPENSLEFVGGNVQFVTVKLQALLDAFAREHLRVRFWTIDKVERVEFPLDRLPEEES